MLIPIGQAIVGVEIRPFFLQASAQLRIFASIRDDRDQPPDERPQYGNPIDAPPDGQTGANQVVNNDCGQLWPETLHNRADEPDGTEVRAPLAAIMIDHEDAPWTNLPKEGRHGALRIRSVLQHTETQDNVEHPLGERQRSEIGLDNLMACADRASIPVGLDRRAEIDRRNSRTASEKNLRESPGATTALENCQPWKGLPQLGAERVLEPVR